ncbi:MAG: DnaD domain protein [Clostridia bacterium]|nr:DnaD domain protein [Clostridia bacterium]
MPFSALSKEALINTSTIVDNMFITDFMPNADEIAVKVYLYGLFQCANKITTDNSLDSFSLALGVERKQIIDSIKYWESVGAVRIIRENPLEFEYIPLKTIMSKPRKYNADKYADFVSQIENMILSRPLTPNELIKYIEVVEDYKISTDAMILIAKYCVDTKSQNIHTNYILTVAKAWANEGVKSVEQVEEKLKEMEAQTDSMRQVFFALGLKSTPDFEDKQYYIKWTTSWGYDLESIVFTAKLCKKRGGIKKLDSMLDNFYRLGLFTLADIKEQSERIEYYRNLAININKLLGVYYENIDTVVEQYIVDWIDKGYDATGLKIIASYCFKNNIKTLDRMNSIIYDLYTKGIISGDSIKNYYEEQKQIDLKIKGILKAIGTSRAVTNTDRDYYNTWTNIWGMSDEILNYASEVACGKSFSFAYLNSLIANYKQNNVKSVEDCKKISVIPSKIGTNSNNSQIIADKHIYSKEELDQLFNKEDESNFDF